MVEEQEFWLDTNRVTVLFVAELKLLPLPCKLGHGFVARTIEIGLEAHEVCETNTSVLACPVGGNISTFNQLQKVWT